MSTLSKEAIETGSTKDSMISPTVSAGVSPASPGPSAAEQVHSDAVSLEVALKVHGSKVSGGTRGVPGQTEPFEEETSSMIVFAHGGVLRMATAVNVGQMLVVTNLKTRQDAICRVVKVRNYSNSASYVEVEFTSKQPGYWGVYFESEAAEVTGAASTPGSGLSSSMFESKPSGVSSTTDDSTFVSFGTQEEVQPSASSTAGASVSSRKSQAAASEAVMAKKPRDAGASASDSAAMSNANLEPESKSVRSAGEALGSRLGGRNASEEQSAGNKKLAMGAGGVVLLAAIVGGALFFNHKPTATASSTTPSVALQTPVSQPQPVSAPSPSPTVTPSSANARTNVTPSVATQPAPSTKTPRQMAVVRETAAVSEPVAQPEPAPTPAAAQPAPASSGSRSSMPSVFGTLNAHPVAQSRNVAAAAPNVEASAPSVPDNSLLGIGAPSNTAAALPAPTVNANTPPLPVGGRVKQPVIAKSVAPQYPSLAKQAHTQGDVAVQIVIDRAGNVTEGKAISGPPVLRQAAVDAVRNWKFQPSVLDGQAISVQTLVTVRFQL